jgi:HD-GYP domain-containing protein (c-di-GMP phosphodiesterase class II)
VLVVSIDEARAGMKLAAPVCHPERPEQELLRAGFVLEDTILGRMREIGIEYLYVDYPSLESLDKHLTVYLSPARQQVLKQIRQSMAASQKTTQPSVAYQDYCSATQQLIDTLMTQGQNPIYLDQMSRQGQDLVQHAAAVAHLSLLLALRLDQYLVDQRSRLPAHQAKDCVALGVAGMLHDIGLTKLNPALARYSDADPPGEPALVEEWKSHCEVGYEMLHNELPGTAAAAVLQHHQHFDGSGFPKLRAGLLEGERIHVFARILLAANLYDRLARPAGGGKARSNLEVYRLLQQRHAGWVDPEVLRVLRDVVPLLPPGQRVRLADGTRAIVLECNHRTPDRPIVQRLASDNWTATGPRLDLTQPGMPAVAEPGLVELAQAA